MIHKTEYVLTMLMISNISLSCHHHHHHYYRHIVLPIESSVCQCCLHPLLLYQEKEMQCIQALQNTTDRRIVNASWFVRNKDR